MALLNALACRNQNPRAHWLVSSNTAIWKCKVIDKLQTPITETLSSCLSLRNKPELAFPLPVDLHLNINRRLPSYLLIDEYSRQRQKCYKYVSIPIELAIEVVPSTGVVTSQYFLREGIMLCMY